MRQWATGAALLALLLGCRTEGARTLRDTEGRTFSADCREDVPCELSQRSGPTRPDRPGLVLHTGSRLVGICDVKQGAAVEGTFDCRPLGCSRDQDCPPLHGMKDGQCLNGRCSDPAEPVGVADAVMSCLAGTGLGRETPEQIERYALALNCGSPCQVPAPCTKP